GYTCWHAISLIDYY
ncbi:hypothetical protein SLEP1_g54155, partial [Rubroshorea leprosula]